MQLVINLPNEYQTPLTRMAHAVRKPVEQYVEDFVLEAVRQRFFHLRKNEAIPATALCGFTPQMIRGDRPAVIREMFYVHTLPERRCPECQETDEQQRFESLRVPSGINGDGVQIWTPSRKSTVLQKQPPT